MATTQFGKYQLIKKLATGGMAEVFLARQSMGGLGDSRHVVVKRILPHLAEDPEFIQMFQNEARVAAKFSHPNIAQIFDYGEENGTYFIAMEFIHGEDLGRLMRKAWSSGQWIARPLAIRIVANACEGLYYAHTRKDEEGRALKVVHRDISPQNILVSFDGSVKLVDFGIAKAADQLSMTKSGAIKGKFAYMAPEQAGGKPLDARTDVFAIGLVLYELLTGVRPLKRDSELATLQAALECAIEDPSAVADVPSELDEVVMRALRKAPDDRYKDARAFQMALEEFLISQRLVASSVQISELMETLFADRRAEEDALGAPNPSAAESGSAAPAAPAPPEAPPPRPSGPKPRPRRAPVARESEVEEPRAPTVMPSRKYSNPNRGVAGNAESTRARPSTEPSFESTRARPSTEPSLEAVSGELRPRPSPARKSATFSRLEGTPPEGAKSRLTSGTVEMPAAPPRKSRATSLSSVNGQAAQPRKTGLQKAEVAEVPEAKVEPTPPRSLLRPGPIALVVAVVVGAGLLLTQVGPSRPNGVPILLTVSTNPKTRVLVVPSDPARKELDLGDAPLDKASGALVGDTIVLQNQDMCIRYEEPIQFGEPFKERRIEKIFGEGQLKVSVIPNNLKDLSMWCNNQRIGNLGLPVKLYEGKHSLEIRGDSLKGPVPFEVNIVAGDKMNFLPKPLDLTSHLEK